jgi:ABC-type uncharacterized transport system permease subunit
VTDAVVGIAVAFLALAISPLLIKTWDKMAERKSAPTK